VSETEAYGRHSVSPRIWIPSGIVKRKKSWVYLFEEVKVNSG
jgi:hypothetical protein